MGSRLVPNRRQGRERRPLARKPKQLTEAPSHFTLSTRGAGAVLEASGRVAPSLAPARRYGAADGAFTDDQAAHAQVDADGQMPLAAARALAERISRSMSRRAATARASRPASRGAWTSVPWRGGSGEIDLEATVERIVASSDTVQRDLVVRERVARRRAIAVAVDVSGSSRGSRLLQAAATVGALIGAASDDDIAVIAFWSDAATLLELGGPADADTIIERLAGLSARGLTNVSFPLELAARALATSAADDRIAILLSDCVHNAGPDPRDAAATLQRLDVLLDVTGECDRDLGAELAAAGRGRCHVIRHAGDIGAGLASILDI